MSLNEKRMLDREALRSVIQQWNANRLDLFELSEPNENLEFHGVMRFYFQDIGQKVATKCIRVASDATVADVIETLIEKFRPDMRMLSVPNYALYEVHANGEERKLNPDEKPLLVQLNWHVDDREGRFLLKDLDQKPTVSREKAINRRGIVIHHHLFRFRRSTTQTRISSENYRNVKRKSKRRRKNCRSSIQTPTIRKIMWLRSSTPVNDRMAQWNLQALSTFLFCHFRTSRDIVYALHLESRGSYASKTPAKAGKEASAVQVEGRRSRHRRNTEDLR
jgi:Ras association (RalGDS/AF-6) domain